MRSFHYSVAAVVGALSLLLGTSSGICETVNGVVFSGGTWTPKNHAEPSYAAFKTYLDSQTPKLTFGDGDFYSAIQIIPQFTPVDGACSDDASDVEKFFRGLFGKTKTALVVVTLSASQAQGHLGLAPFATDIPVLWAGKGVDPVSNQQSSDGCFFGFIPTQRAPYVRHDGSSQQDYYLQFNLRAADQVDFNLVATLKDVLTQFSSVFSWTDLTGARINALATAGTDLQNALKRAFSSTNTVPVKKPLLTKGTNDLVMHLQLQNFDQATGNMAIYTRLSSSILLDNISGDTITMDNVLSDTEVGTVRCIPEMPKPTCTLTPKTFRDALRAYDKDIPPRIFDLSPDGRKKVYDTCEEIRTFATGNLRLSTMDALLVRWATIKLGKLDKAIADPATLADIAKASNVSPQDIIDRCWTADDDKKINGVVKAMNKKLL